MRASLAIVLAALAFASTGSAATSTSEPLYPNVSPDGAHLAWVEGATSRLVVANVDGSGAHTLAVAPTGEGVSQLTWTPLGVLADSNFAVWLLSADGKRWSKVSSAGLSFAVGGSRVASGPERGPGRLVVGDVRTHTTVLMGSPKVNNSEAALSPDGGRVAWTAAGSLWIAPIGGRPERLARHASCPQWSPDGRSIAYLSAPDDALRVKPAAGGAPRALVAQAYTGCNVPGAPAWSPDSRSIAFERRLRAAVVDVATGRVTTSAAAIGRSAGGFAWAPDSSALTVSARPQAREQAGDNCTNLWRLDARSLRGRIVVRGCP